jgi:hypothetical protein
MANGDPDEVIEGAPHRGPGMPETPPADGNGENGEAGNTVGDPDEFVEGKGGGHRPGAASGYNLRLWLDALSRAWMLVL